MKANRTYIDGTTICPVCNRAMARFQYEKNEIGGVSTRTDWAQWKKITTWQETPYDKGIGCMCLRCYGKRKLRFWLIFVLLILTAALSIIIGAKCSIKPLLYVGIGIAAVFLILICSKSAQELYDLRSSAECKLNPAQEFVHLLIKEHPGEFNRNDMVRASKMP